MPTMDKEKVKKEEENMFNWKTISDILFPISHQYENFAENNGKKTTEFMLFKNRRNRNKRN